MAPITASDEAKDITQVTTRSLNDLPTYMARSTSSNSDDTGSQVSTSATDASGPTSPSSTMKYQACFRQLGTSRKASPAPAPRLGRRPTGKSLLGRPSPKMALDKNSVEASQAREEAMKQVACAAAKYREELQRRCETIEAEKAKRSSTFSSFDFALGGCNKRLSPTSFGSTPLIGNFDLCIEPEEAVIILDWDDTLLPTWYITEVVRPVMASGRHGPISKSCFAYKVLEAHAAIVRKVLVAASSVARVAIVTLAQRPWVLSSAEWYLPGLDLEDLLRDLGIRIYYAAEHVNPCFARLAVSEAHEGVNPYQVAKCAAINKVLKRHYRGSSLPWNVLSVGDSCIEHDALTELMWSRATPGDQVALCKTVKFIEEPNAEQLGNALELVAAWLQRLSEHDSDLDLDISALGHDALDLDKWDPLRSS